MRVKTFSIKEANRMIPRVKIVFDNIYVIKKKISLLRSEMEWLREFWKDSLHDGDNPDSDKYCLMSEQIDDMNRDIADNVRSIQKMGGVVKDVDSGLVDFYTMMDGQLAFLCWRYGEKEIIYWHPVSSSYRGRQHLRAK